MTTNTLRHSKTSYEQENQNRSRNSDVQRKPDDKRKCIIRRNPAEQYKRTRSIEGIREKIQTSMKE